MTDMDSGGNYSERIFSIFSTVAVGINFLHPAVKTRSSSWDFGMIFTNSVASSTVKEHSSTNCFRIFFAFSGSVLENFKR